MAENAIKIKKIKEAGKVVYPATILDAIKDATQTINEQTNANYGKTLRQILAEQASGSSAEVEALDKKLHGDSTASDQAVKDGELKTLETTVKTYTDDAVKALNVTENVSDAVAGVSVTVNEAEGKVSKPVVAVADNAVTYQPKVEAAEGVEAKDRDLTVADEDAVLKGDAISPIKDYIDATVAAAGSDASADLKELDEKLYGNGKAGDEKVNGDINDINADIEALQNLHADKTGEGATGKMTVAEEAAAAVAKVVDRADDAFDTLKEIANWINDSDANAEGYNALKHINDLETSVGEATVGTVGTEGYKAGSGLTKRIEDLEAVNTNRNLTSGDTAETDITGKYVSKVSQAADGKITVTHASLPTLSLVNNSDDYLAAEGHEIGVKVATLDSVGLVLGEDGKWAPGVLNDTKGLAIASDVAAEIVNDEKVIAAALNDHEERVAALEDLAGETSVSDQIKTAIEALNVTTNTSDAVKGVTVAVTETDGKVNKPVVSVTPATVTFTAASGAAEAALAATANTGNVLDSTAISAIKSYVDDRFSTEACSDTADYADVF